MLEETDVACSDTRAISKRMIFKTIDYEMKFNEQQFSFLNETNFNPSIINQINKDMRQCYLTVLSLSSIYNLHPSTAGLFDNLFRRYVLNKLDKIKGSESISK